jgi:hypothetical protein
MRVAMSIHCSACGALLPRQAKSCPACALPLTAPIWPYFVLAFLILWVVAYASGRVAERYHQHALATFRNALQPDGALATPAAFQAACGHASEIAARWKETLLTYANPARLTVHFVPGKHVSFTRKQVFRDDGGSWHDIEDNVSEDVALSSLDCSARLQDPHAQ